jgi:hypothetical protein
LQVAPRNNFCLHHHASDALDEVAHIASGLEADQIELKESAQEPLLLRKLRKNVVRRKGDVQEKRQSRKFLEQAPLAQCLGDVHEVVVMHPDEIIRLRAAADGIRVTLVNLFVSLPVCRLEVAEVLQIVEKRPDHLVGIAVVKFVALGFTESHRHNFVAGVTCGFG